MPSGRAMFCNMPAANGSGPTVKTIGMAFVCCCTTRVVAPPEVMITSGARPTSSAAEARIWLRFAARGHPAALAEALDSWPH